MVLDKFEPADIREVDEFFSQVTKVVSTYGLQLNFAERFEPYVQEEAYKKFVITNFVRLESLKTVSALQRSIIEQHLLGKDP